MLKIKVCGMRDKDNIAELIEVQPDFMGFIFHEKSPRNVTNLPTIDFPENIKKVGVFVNKSQAFIQEKARDFPLDYIQLHGSESPEYCAELKNKGFKIVKAFNIHPDFDFERLNSYESICDFFIFDAFGKEAGGNGIVFNWKLLDNYRGKTPFLLSGGINENMVEEIRKISHPQLLGVDINSGFEIKPGLKNTMKVKQFLEGIKTIK